MSTTSPAASGASPGQAATPYDDERLTAVESTGARRLQESWPSTPHFYLRRDADASALLTARDRLRDELAPRRISITVPLLMELAGALRDHPRVNSEHQGRRRRVHHRIDLGVAVATPAGLMAPVMRGADARSALEVTEELERLASGAQEGTLTLDDMTGATFTVSNLGMYGIDQVHPTINPPNAAILGVGRVRDDVRPIDGQPAVRPVMSFVLAADHRVIDGATAAAFLRDLVERIENVDGDSA